MTVNKMIILKMKESNLTNESVCWTCISYHPNEKYQCSTLDCYRKPGESICDEYVKRKDVFPYFCDFGKMTYSGSMMEMHIKEAQ